MPIEPGRTLLHYRVVEKIGEGGMGSVWRAEDTTLDRQVAIKVLPREFASDPERLARFEREAKLLASLNHPNIAAIYGLHPQTGSGSAITPSFIAMELIEGEDLSMRLVGGPLGLDVALEISDQVCDALEAAHDNGVIHRDLKPANIQVTRDGKIKVLDFGLAKALEPRPASGSRVALSPTVTSAGTGTAAGVVLGTAAYMSPEQARGEPVDQRADVWAFGCLLFEVLSGQRPFAGKSMTDILAAVVRDEPDWDALPRETPSGVRRLLRHCLAKDPRKRLRHMGDARLALGDVTAGDVTVLASESRPVSRALVWVPVLIAIALIVVMIFVLKDLAPFNSAPLTRADLRLEDLEGTTNRWGTPPIALSPDGRTVAYVAGLADGDSLLRVRSLDSYELRPLPGTEGATGPFFSPDGQWLGFFTDDELLKVPVSGGTVQSIHRFEAPWTVLGAVWTPDDSIVFGVERVGLLEVSASGGDTALLTAPDRGSNETNHGFPFVLPNGDLLFTVSRGVGGSGSRPAMLSRESGEWHTLLPDGQSGNQPHYLPSGHVIFANGDSLLAAPFDPSRGELTRGPVVVVDKVHVDLGSGVSVFDLSSRGTLLYLPLVQNRLVWVDRRGVSRPILDAPGDFLHPRLSPDGRKVALLSRRGADTDVWVVDVERQSLERLTHGGDHAAPLWTVDGSGVTFAQNNPSSRDIVVQRADGSGQPAVVLNDGHENWPMSWSPDGRTVAFERRAEDGSRDLMTHDPEGNEDPREIVATPFNEESPRISPDGRWIAYASDHTGDYEVYVSAYPSLDRRFKVSSDGGAEPVWGPDADELIFRQGSRVVAASLSTDRGTLRVGRPTVLFEGAYNRSQVGHAHYDIAPDGERFVMVAEDQDSYELLRIVVGWEQELAALAPE